MGRAWASIDLTAITANVKRLTEAAGGAAVMAVVKADAYGHGLVPVARAARRGGASWLGVALLEEAVALRLAGDAGRILAWLACPGDDFERCVRFGVDLSASDTWMINEISSAAARVGRPALVHLKVDTGLGRGGATKAQWADLVRLAASAQDQGVLRIVGLWSHFAYADCPDHPTVARQLAQFDEAIDLAARLGVTPEVRHIANSAATLTKPSSHYDLVRPGIAVYGISPGPAVGTSRSLGLRPAMTLSARLAQVKRLPVGSGISYGHQYVTSAETTVGLVPVGYADGLPRASTNAAHVLAAGRVRTVAGRMCMDQFVLDFGNDDAWAGDEVVIFGPGDDGEPTADDWAAACDTISYEIVTRIGPRIPRVFVGGM
ncbi:MAG: alanine racemase [Actinomycetes bacterium]